MSETLSESNMLIINYLTSKNTPSDNSDKKKYLLYIYVHIAPYIATMLHYYSYTRNNIKYLSDMSETLKNSLHVCLNDVFLRTNLILKMSDTDKLCPKLF